jgi:hypothetical protein
MALTTAGDSALTVPVTTKKKVYDFLAFSLSRAGFETTILGL